MAFSNPVVGGDGGELIRDSIKSPNYLANTTGWIIKRDGSAEFNNILIRGSLIVTGDAQSANFVPGVSGWRLRSTGAAEFNGNATINNGTLTGGIIQTATSGQRIVLRVISGIPTIEFYDGTHPLPSKINAYNLGTNGGMQFTAGDPFVESTALIASDNLMSMLYDKQTGTLETAFLQVGPPLNQLIKLRTTSALGQDLELGFDYTRSTPDLLPGRMYTVGEICIQGDGVALGSNYPSRVIDGKAPGATTATTINLVDTTIGTANSTNVYLEDGWAYRCIVQIDYRNNNVGGRLEWKLWDGAVGALQLGGTCRRWTSVASTTQYEGEVLVFIWKQAGTGISSNINLSALRSIVTAGAATAEVNAAFSMIIEKIGDANRITNL